MTRSRRALATVFAVATAVSLTACGPDNAISADDEPVIQERTIKVHGVDVICAYADTSRGIALSCAWPDSIRNADPE